LITPVLLPASIEVITGERKKKEKRKEKRRGTKINPSFISSFDLTFLEIQNTWQLSGGRKKKEEGGKDGNGKVMSRPRKWSCILINSALAHLHLDP